MATRKFPTVPPYTGNNEGSVVSALAGVVGYITAQQQPVVQPITGTFASTMTSAQISATTLAQAVTAVNVATLKINEVIARLQGTQ